VSGPQGREETMRGWRSVVSIVLTLALSGPVAWLILGLFYIVGDNYYESHGRSLGDALVWFQVLFYVTLSICILAAVGLGVVVSKVLSVPSSKTIAAVLFVLGLALVPMLSLLSYVNSCTFGQSFPFSSECS